MNELWHTPITIGLVVKCVLAVWLVLVAIALVLPGERSR